MRPRKASARFIVAVAVVVSATASTSAAAQWRMQASGTRASLRGLSVVDARTAWASGTGGTVVHTTDGGTTWRVDTVPGAARMDLRSIHARSARVAHVAATAGRIWRTTDGGRSWTMTWQATDTTVFLDAIDFWDDRNGVALGDPMGDRFLLLVTRDGGETWREAAMENRPATMPGEAAFAASASSLVIDGDKHLWIGSGGRTARLFHSTDRGSTWTAFASPLLQGGASQGIFSLAAHGGRVYAVGGDYERADSSRANEGVFGGSTSREWAKPAELAPRGFRSGVAAFGSGSSVFLIAVGPSGSDQSRDGGRTWSPFDATGFHAVRASRDGVFFASGSGGRIGIFDARAAR